MDVEERIEQVLEKVIRPALRLHGGGIESVSYQDGVYRFRLTGSCANCPSARLETEELIGGALPQAVPEVRRAVLEAGVSQELLDQARALLSGREAGPGRV